MTNEQRKEILVLGATGGTGQAIVRAALERGYGVTCLVRDMQRAEHTFNGLRTKLNLVEGDALQRTDVDRAMGHDINAVICSLGVFHPLPGRSELSDATKCVLGAMQAAGLQRLVCISSLGVGDSRGQGDATTRLIQKTSLRFTLPDKENQEGAIRDSGLDWTIIRPTRLMNGDGPDNWMTWSGAQPDEKLQWSVNRTHVATLALDCLDRPDTIAQALNITGCPDSVKTEKFVDESLPG